MFSFSDYKDSSFFGKNEKVIPYFTAITETNLVFKTIIIFVNTKLVIKLFFQFEVQLFYLIFPKQLLPYFLELEPGYNTDYQSFDLIFEFHFL